MGAKEASQGAFDSFKASFLSLRGLIFEGFVVLGSIWTSFWRPWDIKNIANLTKMKRKAVACNAYTIALSSHFSATPCLFESISSILLLAGAGYCCTAAG